MDRIPIFLLSTGRPTIYINTKTEYPWIEAHVLYLMGAAGFSVLHWKSFGRAVTLTVVAQRHHAFSIVTSAPHVRLYRGATFPTRSVLQLHIVELQRAQQERESIQSSGLTALGVFGSVFLECTQSSPPKIFSVYELLQPNETISGDRDRLQLMRLSRTNGKFYPTRRIFQTLFLLITTCLDKWLMVWLRYVPLVMKIPKNGSIRG